MLQHLVWLLTPISLMTSEIIYSNRLDHLKEETCLQLISKEEENMESDLTLKYEDGAETMDTTRRSISDQELFPLLIQYES